MRITYTNSAGHSFELTAGSFSKIKTANFHNWSWTAQASALQYGEKIQMLKKPAATYAVEIYVRGTKWEREAFLRGLHEAAAYDLQAQKTGVLQWGEWKLDCYITASSTYPHDSQVGVTVNQITVYAPHPFWYTIDTFEIETPEQPVTTGGLDFPFDFPFDFTAVRNVSVNVRQKHYRDCDFILTIHGYASSPNVIINGHPYQVFTEVPEGGTLVIDSRNKTVTKTYASGATENCFGARRKDFSVFDRIPAGELTIARNSAFDATLALIYERDEPTLWI